MEDFGCFCFLSATEGKDGLEIGFGWFCLSARSAAAGLVDLGDMSLERCLTISSEERETWTAVSLRVLCELKGERGTERDY